MNLTPDLAYLTKGVGQHREKLASFELALRDAGIQAQNIVTVSSIFPPKAELIAREEGQKLLRPGQVLFTVMARQATNESGRLLAASVGLAIPSDRSSYGYLSEHSSYGEDEKKAGDYAEDLAAEMLATTLGIPFDVDESWDEKRNIWKISGKIVQSTNITQTAVGREGYWMTVVAAAVLLSSNGYE